MLGSLLAVMPRGRLNGLEPVTGLGYLLGSGGESSYTEGEAEMQDGFGLVQPSRI